MTPRPSRHLFVRPVAVTFLAVVLVCTVLGIPRRVMAQVGMTSEGPPLGPLWFKEMGEKTVAAQMKDSFAFNLQLAIVNMLNTFAQNFAYETAVWIASGGKAQSPLFDGRTVGDFVRDTATGAGLQFIDDLDKYGGNQLGFDGGFGIAQFICAPSAEFKLVLKLALQNRLKPKPPLCTWRQLSQNWSTFTSTEGLQQSLAKIGAGFEAGESDLSAALELHGGITDKLTAATFEQLNERIANKGFRPLQDKISGLTKTPADVVQGKATEAYVREPNKSVEFNATYSQGIVSSFDNFFPMLGAAAQTLGINFAVTLAAQALQQQVLSRGIFTIDQLLSTDAGSSSDRAPRANVREQARTVYADFKRPRVTSSGNYDMLGEFATCDPARRQPTTCVLDAQFQEAVRKATSNQPMSVREAIDAGLLHGDWPLISERNAARDQDPLCAQSAYCASNLAKLRRARIIPVGWEFAANNPANTAEHPVLLSEVVDAFMANGKDGICGTAGQAADGGGDEAESPYCGLIDPNWILELPITQCRIRGPGETLLEPTASLRADVCTDTPTCLQTDANGQCVDRYGDEGYGYCLREQNAWKIQGRTCPPQMASCRAYTDRSGGELAVLTSTTNRSVCNAENAGCRWYAASRDAAGAWRTNDRRYFNRNVEQCEEANEGCSEFIPQAAAEGNLIVNPSFERDDNRDGIPDEWATDPTKTVYSANDTAVAVNGHAAVQPKYCNGDDACAFSQSDIPIIPGRTYTLSASARQAVANASGTLRFHVKLWKHAVRPANAGSTAAYETANGAATTGLEGTCTAGDGHTNGLALYVTPPTAGSAPGTALRSSCWFIAPPDATVADVVLMSNADATAVMADAVQFEAGTTASAFTDAYQVNAPHAYLKVAPADRTCAMLKIAAARVGARALVNDARESEWSAVIRDELRLPKQPVRDHARLVIERTTIRREYDIVIRIRVPIGQQRRLSVETLAALQIRIMSRSTHHTGAIREPIIRQHVGHLRRPAPAHLEPIALELVALRCRTLPHVERRGYRVSIGRFHAQTKAREVLACFSAPRERVEVGELRAPDIRRGARPRGGWDEVVEITRRIPIGRIPIEG